MRERWSLVAAYAAVAGSNQLLWLTYAPLTTEAAEHFGVGVAAVGWLSEIFPLLYVVLAIPAAIALARRLRPALAVGAALNGGGAVLRVIEPSYAGALAGQIMIAVAQPLILAAVTAVADQAVSEPSRPKAIGLASAGLFAGILASLIMAPLFGGAAIQTLVAVQAGIAVVASISLGLALWRPRWRPTTRGRNASLRAVLGQPPLRMLIVIAAAGFGVFVALTTWLQPLLAPAGVSPTAAGVQLVIFVAAGVIGGALLPAPLIRRGLGPIALGSAVVVTAVGCLVLAAAPGRTTGFVVAAAAGCGLLTALPVILSLVERRAGAAGPTATGLVWLAGNAAGIVVALAVQGFLARPALAFVLMAVVIILALPAVLRLRRLEAAGQPTRSDPAD